MRKIIVNAHVSLDGVMQAPGGPDEDPGNGFVHGGWSAPYADERSGELLAASMAEPFDLLLGRRTYQIFAGYWPCHGDNPIGVRFNSATKYVVTRTLYRLDWMNSECIDGEAEQDVAEAIGELKSGHGRDLHTWGSSQLLQLLAARGLIDEYRLFIYPLILGRGKRLFESGVPAQAFSLVSTETTSTGVMFNVYRPIGPVRTGTYSLDSQHETSLAREASGAQA